MIELAGCWVTVTCTAVAVVCAWRKTSALAASVAGSSGARPSRPTAATRPATLIAASRNRGSRLDSRTDAANPHDQDRCASPHRSRASMCRVSSPPQVVAHRGASEDEAEHTLAAYRRAIDDGADGLECDVRLTRDGVLVCVHDRRIDRTSSGRGVVSTLELADLAELDFGSWHGAADASDPMLTTDWEAPDWDRRQVLTLERLLQVVVDCGRPLDLAIETKHPTRYAGLVELTLVDLLARHGLTRPPSSGGCQARVMSFATSGLRRIQALAPTVPTVHLLRRVPLWLREGVPPRGVTALGPSLPALRAHPDFVARVHDNGAEVHVWTVDDPDDVDFVAQLGVDVIITNRPAAVLRQLDGDGVGDVGSSAAR